MEPIGQKATLTSSEEAIFTTDLEVESVEKETEKIFDSTLDQMLSEEFDYEDMLEELLEKDSQDSLISYVHQNQFDSEIRGEETADAMSDNTLFPTEIMKPDFLSEDSRHVQSNFMQKSVPIAEEMIEIADPRIVIEESNFVNLEESGIAETGLQTLLDETSPDNSNTVLQKFIHQVEHVSDEDEPIEDELQAVLKQNAGEVFNSKESVEITRSSLHTIMHKTSNATALPEDVVLPEEAVVKTGNEIKSANHKTSIETELPEERVVKTGNEIKSANHKTSIETELPEEAVVKIVNEIKSANHKISNETALPEERVVQTGNEIKLANHKTSNETALPEERVVQTGNEIKSANHKTSNETALPEERVVQTGNEIKLANHKTSIETELPEEAVVKIGNEIRFETDKNLVRQIQNHEDIVRANQKTAGETQTFNQNNSMPPVSSHLISGNSQDAQISSGDPAKNLLAGSTLSKEQLKASESKQVVENIIGHEGSHTKASISEIEDFTVEAKSKVSDGLQISEKDKSAPEAQSLIRSKVSDVSKHPERMNVTEDLKGQVKGKVSEDLIAKDMFKSHEELKETPKAKEIFQNTSTESTKVSSEKSPVTPVNQFRTLASKENKLSGNSNYDIEPLISTGTSSLSETSGTSIYKTPDSMNPSTDSLRNLDPPFDIQQLVSRVRILRGNGVEEMTLRLHPEELGQITLKVRQSGGDLLIDMRVDNPLAKQLIESGFDSLRNRFLDQEFSYKDLALNVDINQRDSQFGSDRQYEEFEDELFSAQRGKEQEISTLEETPLERHRTDSGLNLYV